PPFQFFQQGYPVEKEPAKIVKDIDGHILVADKFEEVHQVIRFQLVSIRLVGAVRDQQGIRHLTENASGFYNSNGPTEWREKKTFRYLGRYPVVIVSAAKHAFHAGAIIEVKNRIFGQERCAV